MHQLNTQVLAKEEFPQNFYAIWQLEKIYLLLILLQGHVARAPAWADTWGCPYQKS